jgi:hypothetical protein
MAVLETKRALALLLNPTFVLWLGSGIRCARAPPCKITKLCVTDNLTWECFHGIFHFRFWT